MFYMHTVLLCTDTECVDDDDRKLACAQVTGLSLATAQIWSFNSAPNKMDACVDHVRLV